MRITREYLRDRGACWTDDEIAEVVPPDGMTAVQVLDLEDIDAADRLWVLVHDDCIGRAGVVAFAGECAVSLGAYVDYVDYVAGADYADDAAAAAYVVADYAGDDDVERARQIATVRRILCEQP